MSIYESQICDICGEKFTRTDDIVVCPDCGAPFHRRCWNKVGHCTHEDEHAYGFEWPSTPIRPAIDSGIKCPNCGAVMPEGTLFCENCGCPLPIKREESDENAPARNGEMSFEEYMENARLAAEREMRGEMDGVRIKDMAIYIGPNASYYVSKFKRSEVNSRYKPFCWTAFLFPPLYYACRKMYKWALLSALIKFIIAIPSSIMMLVQNGVLPATYMFSGIQTAVQVLTFVDLIICAVFGFLAIPLYKKNVLGDLKRFKQESNGDLNTYYSTIVRKSGLSKVGIALSVLFAINYLFVLFQ